MRLSLKKAAHAAICRRVVHPKSETRLER
jgi:hypothetical protein